MGPDCYWNQDCVFGPWIAYEPFVNADSTFLILNDFNLYKMLINYIAFGGLEILPIKIWHKSFSRCGRWAVDHSTMDA